MLTHYPGVQPRRNKSIFSPDINIPDTIRDAWHRGKEIQRDWTEPLCMKMVVEKQFDHKVGVSNGNDCFTVRVVVLMRGIEYYIVTAYPRILDNQVHSS